VGRFLIRAGTLNGLLALLLAGCAHSQPADARQATCSLAAIPTVLLESGDENGPNGKLLQVWEAPNNPVLWSEATPRDRTYQDFLAKLDKTGIDTDPLAILAASPTHNNDLVASNASDWIQPAGCLEKFLTAHQHARMDTFAAPTEFASLVLRSPDETRLRVYYYTINQDGIGRATPITEPALADVRAGWRLAVALHNHAFHPGQPALNGIVAPSVPDADFNVNLAANGLEQAWITNGLHTVRIPASAFARFQTK
jgi:hypothetical protein